MIRQDASGDKLSASCSSSPPPRSRPGEVEGGLSPRLALAFENVGERLG
jgi:hypothetical protein